MGMVYTLNSPEDIAAEYSGNKQRIAQAAQAGIINPTEAVLAGMFIDRMRNAAVEEQQPNQTVAQEVLAPQQSNVGAAPAAGQGIPSTQPTPAQGVAPTPQQAPMPQGMAMGGVASLDMPTAMYDYGPGGIVAFGEGDSVSEPKVPSIAQLDQMYEALVSEAKSPAEREQITQWYKEALAARRVAITELNKPKPDMDKVMGALTQSAQAKEPQAEGPSLEERIAGIPAGGDELPPEPMYNPRPSSALPEGRSTPSYLLPGLDPAYNGDEPWSLDGDAPTGGDEYAGLDSEYSLNPQSAAEAIAALGEGKMQLEGNETTPLRILQARADAKKPKAPVLAGVPEGGDEYAGIDDAVAAPASKGTSGIPAGGDEYAGIDEVYDPKARIVGNPTENAEVMAQLAAIDAQEKAKPAAGIEALIDPDAPGEDMNFNPDMSGLATPPAPTQAPAAGLGATDVAKQAGATETKSPELKALEDYYNLVSEVPKDTKEAAAWRAIARTGFESMAGQSPYALANFGAAGAKAVGQYGSDIKDIRREALAGAKSKAEFELAKAKLLQGKDTDLRYRTNIIRRQLAAKYPNMSANELDAKALETATDQLTQIQAGKLGLAESTEQRKAAEAARKQAEKELSGTDLALNAMASPEGRQAYLDALDARTNQILGKSGTTAPATTATQSKKGVAIAPNAVKALRADPSDDMIRLFDEKYGKGEAARILGK